LRAMGDRVRLLSATIDALLGQMESGPGAGDDEAAAESEPAKAKKPAAKRSSPAPSSSRRR
ncbi:MAG: hypothetical protein ACRD0O_09660, partial [Acidimicrobiia bacterium]